MSPSRPYPWPRLDGTLRRCVIFLAILGPWRSFVGRVQGPGLTPPRTARPAARAEVATPGTRVRVGISYEFEDDGYPEDVDFNPALEFVCGRGDVVPQIDRGVEGLKIGDQRFIQCDEKNPLFGFHDASKQILVPFADYADAQLGAVISLTKHGGLTGVVLKQQKDHWLVDLNHPLAGQRVNVTITLLATEAVPPREVRVERLRTGDGVTYPIFGDWITMHVELSHNGKLLSSTRRGAGNPLRYHLGFEDSKERGLELGLQQVSLGEVASIQVPARLAYGAQGCVEKEIPPNADLVYKVDILDVESELELAF